MSLLLIFYVNFAAVFAFCACEDNVSVMVALTFLTLLHFLVHIEREEAQSVAIDVNIAL